MTTDIQILSFDPYTTYIIKNDGFFWMEYGEKFPANEVQQGRSPDFEILWFMGRKALGYIPQLGTVEDLTFYTKQFCGFLAELKTSSLSKLKKIGTHKSSFDQLTALPPIETFYNLTMQFRDARILPPAPQYWPEACAIACLYEIQCSILTLGTIEKGALMHASVARDYLEYAKLCYDRVTMVGVTKSALARNAGKNRHKTVDPRKTKAIDDWIKNGEKHLRKWKSVPTVAAQKCGEFGVAATTYVK